MFLDFEEKNEKNLLKISGFLEKTMPKFAKQHKEKIKKNNCIVLEIFSEDDENFSKIEKFFEKKK